MANEIRNTNQEEPIIITPSELGVRIAETQILYLSTLKNKKWTATKEILTNTLFYYEKNLNSLPEEEKQIAKDAYKERMQAALEGKNGKVIVLPSIKNDNTDLEKAA